MVSTFSGKPIFGQDGPKYLFDISKQTICRKIRDINNQNTIPQREHHRLFILWLISLCYYPLIIFNTSVSITAYAAVLGNPSQPVVVFTFLFLVSVKIFGYTYNPQITNAHIFLYLIILRVLGREIYKSNITLNSGLSMLVGISEAIRLLFFNFSFIFLLEIWLINKITRLTVNPVSKDILSASSFFLPLLGINRDTQEVGLKVQRIGGLGSSYYISRPKLGSHSQSACNFKSIINLNKNYSTMINPSKSNDHDIIFNQWLAGLIDGDGCFQLSKKGYASLEIVMETRDKHCLYLIKQKYGGSVKLRSGINWLRFRLHHKKGLLDLINAVNGEIRNPVRLLQLNKICEKYNIQLIQPSGLTYNNGWLSGFFDSDGSVYLNQISSQMFITATQKNIYVLNDLVNLYGGTIYAQKESFKWVVYRKSEIIKLLDYFKMCPSRSAKQNRLLAIKRYHELRELKSHLQTENSILGKAWKKFLLRWDKWEKFEK